MASIERMHKKFFPFPERGWMAKANDRNEILVSVLGVESPKTTKKRPKQRT